MSTYEPCEECGAPLDPQQRYCVNCAARRGNGANPSSRYFAAMSKKARRPLTRPPAKTGPGSRAAASITRRPRVSPSRSALRASCSRSSSARVRRAAGS